jgi:hypothetical protein
VVETSKDLELHPRIVRLTEDLDSFYSEFLREGTSLKDKIDDIEKKIGENQEDVELKKTRDRTVENLDKLVDGLVLTSGKLEELLQSCKRFQDLTTSLLCYSLSRFRESQKVGKRETGT